MRPVSTGPFLHRRTPALQKNTRPRLRTGKKKKRKKGKKEPILLFPTHHVYSAVLPGISAALSIGAAIRRTARSTVRRRRGGGEEAGKKGRGGGSWKGKGDEPYHVAGAGAVSPGDAAQISTV